MITADNMMSVILRTVPGFQTAWQAHLDYWDGNPAGLCNDMQAFSDYVIEELKAPFPANRPTIFDLIEHLLVEGDEAVKNAAATCFLENLLNSVDAEDIDVYSFEPYVGPHSRKYCEAWESFTSTDR